MKDHLVHLGHGRTFSAGQADFIDPTMTLPAKRLLTEHLLVKLDRATHTKLKRAAANRQQPMSHLMRQQIDVVIAEDEREYALAPPHLEPWRKV